MKKAIIIILAFALIFSGSSMVFAADESYNEYFSREREFTVNDDTYEYSTYFFSDEDDGGHLYSHNVDTDEKALVFAQNVTAHYLWDENLYCVVDGKSIVKITVSGQNPQTVLTTDKDISQLYVNDDIIYYLMDNAIYRYHIASQTTDLIVQDDYIYFFYPYSNYVVEWGTGERAVNRLDIRTRGTTFLDEYTFVEEIMANAATAPDVTIHGKSLPYSSYDDGTYYTQTGRACPGTCHNSTGACKLGENCTTCMYIEDGTAGPAMQCHAFACTVFKYLWGGYTAKETQSPEISINSSSKARSALKSLPSGTMLRVKKQTYEHTIILAQVNFNGAIIYDANSNGRGIVRYKEFSFEDIAKMYSSIKTIWRGDHRTGLSYSSDNTYHWYKCSTSSNCNNRSNIGLHSYAPGSNYCSICGRVNTLPRMIEDVSNNE